MSGAPVPPLPCHADTTAPSGSYGRLPFISEDPCEWYNDAQVDALGSLLPRPEHRVVELHGALGDESVASDALASAAPATRVFERRTFERAAGGLHRPDALLQVRAYL